MPQLLVRFYSIKNDKMLRLGTVIVTLGASIALLPYLTGAVARVLVPELDERRPGHPRVDRAGAERLGRRAVPGRRGGRGHEHLCRRADHHLEFDGARRLDPRSGPPLDAGRRAEGQPRHEPGGGRDQPADRPEAAGAGAGADGLFVGGDRLDQSVAAAVRPLLEADQPAGRRCGA